MFAYSYGILAAIIFVSLSTLIYSWMEMRFDQRSTVVFDLDDTRSLEEQKIIHEYFLPIRALALVMITTAGDMSSFLNWIPLLGFTLFLFWIIFDILCAVVWLGQPWYYVGDPPPINPYLFFLIKLSLMTICLLTYIYL